MSEAYSREILKRNVAQICQTIGWNGTNSTPMDILVHILEKYIRTLGTQANRYAEHFNRTEPNLHDLGLVFRDLHINLSELGEYTRCVPSIPPINVEKFPKPKESNLNFLKPGSHEVVTRPMHVHEHLPPMYPERERDTPVVADTIEIRQNGIDLPSTSTTTCQSPEISVTDSPEMPKDIFKRPIDPVSQPNSKRPRLRLEDEERSREISSVMMTMSGFLSPAREGKLPEARPPIIVSEKNYDRHKVNSHHSYVGKPPSHSPLEKPDKKSKKSKTVNGKVMKSKRKDKSHKGESSKSKDNNKYPPGYPIKNKDVQPTHHNHITMPAPKPLPTVPSTMLPPPPPVSENVKVSNTVIKQEPIDLPPPPISRTALPGEEAIPVPRKIPISKSPLVSNHLVSKHPLNTSTIIQEKEIKREKVDDDVKLASQPDRSKINIFKRISNKSKEDKITPEVVPDKCQSDNLISRLQAHDGLRIESRNHKEHVKVKPEGSHVNNNDDTAVDLSNHVDLSANEVISIKDDLDVSTKVYPEPRPIPISVSKSLQLPNPKAVPGVSSKPKKEKKHKDKRDKSIQKAEKMIRKQQLAMAKAMQADNQNFTHLKSNSKPPKSSRSKNAKVPHIGFPFYPPNSGLMPHPGFIPGPGLIPSADYLAGFVNNPALRGLAPPSLLSNPFALGAAGPGLIPSSSFLPGNLRPGMPPMSMNDFARLHQQPRNIPPLLRRPSLEVIPVANDNVHKSSSMVSSREKDRHEKHKSSTIPNILQKQKSKSHKESHHKSNMLKMPHVQPDVTIQLNPPKVEPPRPEPIVKAPVRPASPVIEKRPEPVLEPTPGPEIPVIIKEEKVEKKKDKSHKKDKKDKDGLKVKKKKDKKDKNKDKSEKKRDKEEKQELKDRIKKEKKEKKKEKQADGLVPKLTLKLGSASPMPPGSPDIFKLTIKPVVKKEVNEAVVSSREESPPREHSPSPELAQISALVTRPPKQKHSSKHNHSSDRADSPSPPPTGASPPRKNRPPQSSNSKYKRILFKPLVKKSHMEHFSEGETSESSAPTEGSAPPETTGPLPTPYYLDDQGNKVWVCPACHRPDNGTPMIGCDVCDCWYHWVCVGITVDPGASEDWYCKPCLAKRDSGTHSPGVGSSRKRARKSKPEKVKDCR